VRVRGRAVALRERFDVVEEGELSGSLNHRLYNLEKSVYATEISMQGVHDAAKAAAAERTGLGSRQRSRTADSEDAEDLQVFEQRRGGPLLSFEDVVKDLKHRGRI
jgi:hypothetical protein